MKKYRPQPMVDGTEGGMKKEHVQEKQKSPNDHEPRKKRPHVDTFFFRLVDDEMPLKNTKLETQRRPVA